MKCQGKFKYKGITKRDGGSFTNSRGQVINYGESYSLKVDELTDKGVQERIFKVAIDSPLIPQLAQKQLYDEILIEFDITLYSSGPKLTPVTLLK